MSDMRQRRGVCSACSATGQSGKFCSECGAQLDLKEGNPTASQGKNDAFTCETPAQSEAIEHFMSMMQKETEKPKPGLSNEAKKWKDALATDPYDMTFITRLGIAYAADRQWQQSVTVLMRGWKRVSEFKEDKAALEYLQLLAQGSYKLQKFRQALAVLHDISDDMLSSADEEGRSRVHALRCQVHCANGDQQKGLKAFHQAIEGQAFDAAAGHWAACLLDLQKVDLLEVTRSTIQGRAKTDEERQKIEAMEAIVKAKEQYRQEMDKPKYPPALRPVLNVVYVLLGVILIYVLYVWEQRSFASLANNKK